MKWTYPALARAVERPINLTARSVCDDMYLILDTITYKQMFPNMNTQAALIEHKKTAVIWK